MAEFAGWEMPLWYGGAVEEHRAVRETAGLFDVSHMGRFELTGPGATPTLSFLITINPGAIPVGAARYALVCHEKGGILDDVFVYRLGENAYLVVVNASNREKLARWFEDHIGRDTEFTDRTVDTALLALQGPRSLEILQAAGEPAGERLRLREFAPGRVAGVPVTVARTGYTGERGVEIVVPASDAVKVWDALGEAGRDRGLRPAGLAARDTLRLEMGYALYGHEIDESTTPLEAGLEWAVTFEKPDFMGREALLEQKKRGLKRTLVGLVTESGVPRQGYKVLDAGGSAVGAVTSGNLSPMLGKGIAMAYVPPQHSAVGTRLAIEIRGKAVPVEVVPRPFYRKKS